MANFSIIMPAAGGSSRFKDKEKKPFVNLDGRAVWLRSAELFITRPDVVQCLVVVAPNDQEFFRRRFGANLAFMNVQIIDGGKERFDSVANALAKVKEEADFVATHDAARQRVRRRYDAGQPVGERLRSIGAHGDTIRVKHTLRPLGVAMAGRDVRDPYKD